MKTKNRPKLGSRFNRRLWMEKALEVLAQQGSAKLRVDQIAKALGVTKGSFYAHFEGRDDFLESVVHYWDEEYTRRVKRLVDERGGAARDRLSHVVQIVCEEDLSSYDMAVYSWASHEPTIALAVGRTLKFRMDYVASLFRQMGFRGGKLKVRAEALVGFMLLRGYLPSSSTSVPSKRTLDDWLDFFTRA
jgi:AcrR family transcriptional regulator